MAATDTGLDIPKGFEPTADVVGRRYARIGLAVPCAFLILVFGAALVSFLGTSFLNQVAPGLLEGTLSLDSYAKAVADTYYLEILSRTTGMSLTVVVLTLSVGYPLAYYLARKRSGWALVCLGVILASSTMSLVIRALGWIGILASDGVVNSTLMSLGLIESPFRFLGTMAGVIIGLVHGFIPIIVLTLLPILQDIDRSLEEAAEGLGASRTSIFTSIILPLSLPGIISGCSLVFAMSMGAFTTPALLGGGRSVVFSELIYEKLLITLDYSMGSVLAVMLLAIVVAALWSGAALAGRVRARAIST